MRASVRFLIASLCSLIAFAVSFYLGSLFLMLFDPNYHDGFSALGGLAIGVIVAASIFRVVFNKLAIRV